MTIFALIALVAKPLQMVSAQRLFPTSTLLGSWGRTIWARHISSVSIWVANVGQVPNIFALLVLIFAHAFYSHRAADAIIEEFVGPISTGPFLETIVMSDVFLYIGVQADSLIEHELELSYVRRLAHPLLDGIPVA